jgi:hypothetical protein
MRNNNPFHCYFHFLRVTKLTGGNKKCETEQTKETFEDISEGWGNLESVMKCRYRLFSFIDLHKIH